MIVWVLLQVVQRSTAAHEKLEMAEAGRLLYDFVWGDFADWYIEVRAGLMGIYSSEADAASVLCLLCCCRGFQSRGHLPGACMNGMSARHALWKAVRIIWTSA